MSVCSLKSMRNFCSPFSKYKNKVLPYRLCVFESITITNYNDFRYVKSLVVLMVDLLDFPCSIWPGIVDIIGKDRPIIVVGNKVICFY